MLRIRVSRILCVAVVAAVALLYSPGTAHADLGDPVSVVGSTTDQVSKLSVEEVVEPVVKPVAAPTVRVVEQVVKPVVKPVAAPTVRVVEQVVKPVAAPTEQVVERGEVSLTGPARTEGVQSTIGRSPQSSAPAQAPRAGGGPAPSRARGHLASAATRRPPTGVRNAQPQRQQLVERSVFRLNRPPLHELVALYRPLAGPRTAPATRGELELPKGCRTAGFDLSELRRCALAATLGKTGGFGLGVLSTGAALLVCGGLLVARGRRRPLAGQLVVP